MVKKVWYGRLNSAHLEEQKIIKMKIHFIFPVFSTVGQVVMLSLRLAGCKTSVSLNELIQFANLQQQQKSE